MADNNGSKELLTLTAEIVSSHVANNLVSLADLPQLIQKVFSTLAGLDGGAPITNGGPRPQAAVSIKKSVTPDYIVCLEDGRQLKMLKRHLMTSYNLTPEAYRERWQLPPDYPMVAPNYAKQRSSLAKKIGLGTKPRNRRRA